MTPRGGVGEQPSAELGIFRERGWEWSPLTWKSDEKPVYVCFSSYLYTAPAPEESRDPTLYANNVQRVMAQWSVPWGVSQKQIHRAEEP